jgi:hypothetical protein
MSDEKQYGLKETHVVKALDESIDLYKKWLNSYGQTFKQV